MVGMFHSQRHLRLLIVVTCLTQVSSVRFYRLPPTFKLTSNEVDHVTTESIWTCFANAEAYDPEWTHFYFDASSSRCSLRGGVVSFDFTNYWPTGTPTAPLPGNFYVKDVAGRLATVDGCPAETVLRDLACALPEPLPGQVDCSALESLVQITSANETALTNAFFRGKCSEYGGSFYSTTAPYRQSVVYVLWNESLTVAERIQQAAEKLDAMADDDDPIKEDLLSFPVGGWGTMCDFLACTKQRFPSAAINTKKCAGSSATGTLAASTSTALTWTAVTGTSASSVASKTTATATKSSAATTTTPPTTTGSSSTVTSTSPTTATTPTTTAKTTTTTSTTSTTTTTATTPSTTTAPVLCDTGLCTFPDYYRPIPSNGWTTTPNVTSIEACAKQASDKLLSGFVTYDIKAKTCVYGPTVTGFFYGNSTQRSAGFRGRNLAPAIALNSTETELYFMDQVYGTYQCPPPTTLSGDYCVTQNTVIKWGNYLGWRDAAGKRYVLPKSRVIESLCYTCDTEMSIKMAFAGQWFCYSLHPIANPTYNTIKQNACKDLVAGSTVIKLDDKQKECGFLNSVNGVQTAYLGIVLPTGVTTKNATAFKYYDAENPGPLKWSAGRPNNNIAFNVLACDKRAYGSVIDDNPLTLTTLVCKKKAVMKAPCPVV